jgi:hypothetical protein
LFSDLVGSTALSARMDPENLRQFLLSCWNHLIICQYSTLWVTGKSRVFSMDFNPPQAPPCNTTRHEVPSWRAPRAAQQWNESELLAQRTAPALCWNRPRAGREVCAPWPAIARSVVPEGFDLIGSRPR